MKSQNSDITKFLEFMMGFYEHHLEQMKGLIVSQNTQIKLFKNKLIEEKTMKK